VGRETIDLEQKEVLQLMEIGAAIPEVLPKVECNVAYPSSIFDPFMHSKLVAYGKLNK
jgi:hypothetical protein